MKSLKEMKQNGRALRQHLEAAFSQHVTLSQAYEALAVAVGASSWNALAALALAPTSKPEVVVSETITADGVTRRVSGIFQTVDGKAKRYFDATAWFEQAGYAEIAALMEQMPLSHPWEFHSAYGGEELGWAIADFFAGKDEGVDEVFAYIKALNDAGGDCGGSDCYISGPELNAWIGSMFDLRSQRVQEAKHNLAYGRLVLGLNDSTTDPTATVIDDPVVVEEVAGAKPPAEVQYSAKGLFDRMQIISVNLVDVLNEYNVPDECPEWKWVEDNSRWSHKSNNAEPGVWEFMVYVDKYNPDLLVDVPAVLKPFFDEALKLDAPWIMFHQG